MITTSTGTANPLVPNALITTGTDHDGQWLNLKITTAYEIIK